MREKIVSKFYQIKNAVSLKMAGITEKREAGDHLLEVLGVIIIAVIILILFRGHIVNLFNSAMNTTVQSVNNLFTPA